MADRKVEDLDPIVRAIAGGLYIALPGAMAAAIALAQQVVAERRQIAEGLDLWSMDAAAVRRLASPSPTMRAMLDRYADLGAADGEVAATIERLLIPRCVR